MVASLFVMVSFANAIGETWLYFWVGAAIEAALLLLIVRYAWTWPRHLEQPAEAVGARVNPDALNVPLPRPSSV